MKVGVVLDQLHARGVTFSVIGDDQLQVINADRLTSTERLTLKSHKAVIVHYLSKTNRISLQNIGTCGTCGTKTITRADVEDVCAEIMALPNGQQVRLSDVLAHAVPDDYANLMRSECMLAFANSLLQTSFITAVSAYEIYEVLSPIGDKLPKHETSRRREVVTPLDDLSLLNDDRRFIADRLKCVPRSQHTDMLTRYRDIWIGAADAEPDINRKDNTGRRAANTFLLRNEK